MKLQPTLFWKKRFSPLYFVLFHPARYWISTSSKVSYIFNREYINMHGYIYLWTIRQGKCPYHVLSSMHPCHASHSEFHSLLVPLITDPSFLGQLENNLNSFRNENKTHLPYKNPSCLSLSFNKFVTYVNNIYNFVQILKNKRGCRFG